MSPDSGCLATPAAVHTWRRRAVLRFVAHNETERAQVEQRVGDDARRATLVPAARHHDDRDPARARLLKHDLVTLDDSLQ